MTSFVLLDDVTARGFEPFALTRPAGELRAGAELTRTRWELLLGLPCSGFIGSPHLRAFDEPGAARAAHGVLAAGTWIVNARSAPVLGATPVAADASRVQVDGRVAAVRLDADTDVSAFANGAWRHDAAAGTSTEVDGWWLDEVWDLIGYLPEMLTSDLAALIPPRANAGSVTVLGEGAVHVEDGATIEPYVVADTRAGAVLIRTGATVQSFTRLVGPCVVGEGATIVGGRVSGCSIGPRSKISGEISASIVLGMSNKGHDGFIGHSVLGAWVNLGAGTVTSNLKNSYGTVSMWTPSGVRSTGLQFLGALIGDHAKLGIGTRLTTGCVVGAGANVFGTRMPPKVVPPFAWGDDAPFATFELDRFLTVAERVMERRGVTLGADARTAWRAIFDARWTL